jgi:hypothetical protein
VDALAGGGALHQVKPEVTAFNGQALKMVTSGQGAGIAWPALLRKLDRENRGYAQ